MAESEQDWIKKRAYALWEAEGYPTGKDREHWEQAKLEYATLKPAALNGASAKASGGKAAAAVKPPKAASKAAAPKASSPKAAPKTVASKAASAKTASKPPAAITAAVEPAKKRSKKVPPGK
jgi:hypothetical protein